MSDQIYAHLDFLDVPTVENGKFAIRRNGSKDSLIVTLYVDPHINDPLFSVDSALDVLVSEPIKSDDPAIVARIQEEIDRLYVRHKYNTEIVNALKIKALDPVVYGDAILILQEEPPF